MAMTSATSSFGPIKEEENWQELLVKGKAWPMKEAKEADKSSDWRDLQQIVPFMEAAKIDEIRSLYGMDKLVNTGYSNFVYLYCSENGTALKCQYVVRWRRQDGMVQAKGEHCHKEFKVFSENRKARKEMKCRECPFETNRGLMVMREHYRQAHPTVSIPCSKLSPRKKTPKSPKKKGKRKKVVRRRKKEEEFDGLDDLRRIFEAVIEEETIRERQRLAADAARAGAIGCSSGNVKQEQNSPNPAMPSRMAPDCTLPHIEPSPSPPAQTLWYSSGESPFEWAKKEAEEGINANVNSSYHWP